MGTPLTTTDPPDSPGSSALLEALDDEAARLQLTLSSNQRATFARYHELLIDWNERAGLTAIDDPATIARRLFGESLALLVALRSTGLTSEGVPLRIADVGPGGGFPGIPIAIADPALEVTLIESQRRRCEFLETVVRELPLEHVAVVNARAEDAGRDPALREQFDLVVVRAVAALNILVEYALPLLRVGGVLATPKGSRAEEERREASAAIAALRGVELDPVPLSLPDGAPPQQVILVRRDGPLDDRYPRRAGVPARRPIA